MIIINCDITTDILTTPRILQNTCILSKNYRRKSEKQNAARMNHTANPNYVPLCWERCVYPVHANFIAYLRQKISIAAHFRPKEKEYSNIEQMPCTRNE